jgi:hypothetical protein
MPTLYERIATFKKVVAHNVATISQAALDSWLHINLKQREPDIIHDYFRGSTGGGIPVLNQNIAPPFLAEGFEVKFAGVFCHGQPVVNPMKGEVHMHGRHKLANACELGDMHLVFVFLDQHKNIRDQRAILFQAKKRPKAGTLARIDNRNQACLYETADGFDYVTMLSGQRDWPKKRAREKALHYLFCGFHPVSTSSATAPAYVGFEQLLLLFLLDAEGLYFDLSSMKHYRHWSHINRDLLARVSKAAYRGVGRGSFPDLISLFNDFTDPSEYFLKGDEGGISTLLVIVKDRELPAQK